MTWHPCNTERVLAPDAGFAKGVGVSFFRATEVYEKELNRPGCTGVIKQCVIKCSANSYSSDGVKFEQKI